MAPDLERAARAAAEQLAEIDWYHTIDLAPGLTTLGWFDLRHALDTIPFPDVRGKRCLDVGTWDGFYAFEMERRGAAEVVALDVPDLSGIDFPPTVWADPDFDPTKLSDKSRSAGFHLLHELLGSSVTWMSGNIYDLDPGEIGKFDLVIVGSLLIHLRDPVRALDAVRRVTDGQFLSIDYVHPPLEIIRKPWFELRGEGIDFQWWLANSSGLHQMLEVAGFEIETVSKRFLLRFGDKTGRGHLTNLSATRQRLKHRAFTGDGSLGHMHRAFLTRPTF